MKKFLLSFLVLTSIFSFFPTRALSQGNELEECLAYYQFGEVRVNLNTEKTSYSGGEKVELFGTALNENTFPLLNITIYAHLKRINEETLLENGHFLIDRLTLAENLNFLPKETKELSASFEVKENYPQGQYQLQYFVFSKEGFYYSGRPFLEEDFAGVTNFEIKNTSSPLVYFDLNSLTLNGVSQKIREYIPIFNQGDNPQIAVNLADSRSTKSGFLVVYKWYRWDDSFEESLVKTGRTHLFADQAPIFQTVFDLPDPGAYVLLLEVNEPVRSLFKFRIARRGQKANRLRMNDLGLTNYPVDPQKDRAFVCFHSPTEENAPLIKVSLSLFDQQGQVLETKSIEDSFSGEVAAISLPLTKLSDRLNFSVQAEFQDLENPSMSQKVRHNFNCRLFDLCLNTLSVDFKDDKINLQPANLCGNTLDNAYSERLIVFKDGKIFDEKYNEPIPSEIDTSDFPQGDYKFLVKSGQIEKEMEFEAGRPKEPRVKKGNWSLIVFGVLVLVGGGILAYKSYKKKEKNET